MMRKNTVTHPITLYLIGFAGIGKYTIAKEIAKHGYKVVDNHLINNTRIARFPGVDLNKGDAFCVGLSCMADCVR